MRIHGRSSRSAAARVLLCFLYLPGAVLLAGLAGCRSNQPQGSMITARLPIATYAHLAETEGKTRFSFPLLEIYNSDGNLIYHSNLAPENQRVLSTLPSLLRHTQPLRDSSPLKAIVQAVPEFKARSHQLLDSHHPVVVSTVLDNCHACVAQDLALEDAQRKILNQSVDILVIEVTPQ